jgi:FkbM family methyltransferase
MIRFDQWWLPDGEQHLQTWMTHKNQRVDGRLTYQKHKYDAAMQFVQRKRVAIDVGAHVGLWSYWMAQDFGLLHEHIDCWRKNMDGFWNAELHPVALGNDVREVGLETGESSSGDTAVKVDGTGVAMGTLDSYAFQNVDLLKIDCEGYEVFVLEGAQDMLVRCQPVVIVEQKPGHGQRFGRGEKDAVRLLESLGARQVWEYAGDYVLTFQCAS